MIAKSRTARAEKPKAVRAEKPPNFLIFVDTNILLDFYRARSAQGGRGGIELLELIEAHKDILITGSQVEMEYKKNRQRVILETLKAQKPPDWSGLVSPAFLADANPTKAIQRNKKALTTQVDRLRKRIAKILNDPGVNDPVFITLQRVFSTESDYNLDREKKIRFAIRHLARKRFILGYPPRKSGDTSIGDAVNWEWIIACAKSSGKDIIIVTRDTDYGIEYGGQFVLNDWLLLEFKKRISQQRKIILTDRLAVAFNTARISVSAAAESEELSRLASVNAPSDETCYLFAKRQSDGRLELRGVYEGKAPALADALASTKDIYSATVTAYVEEAYELASEIDVAPASDLRELLKFPVGWRK